jgi:hypothetical protein
MSGSSEITAPSNRLGTRVSSPSPRPTLAGSSSAAASSTSALPPKAMPAVTAGRNGTRRRTSIGATAPATDPKKACKMPMEVPGLGAGSAASSTADSRSLASGGWRRPTNAATPRSLRKRLTGPSAAAAAPSSVRIINTVAVTDGQKVAGPM